MSSSDLSAKFTQQALLYDVSRSFSELIDLELLLPFVIAKTKEVLDAESSAVLLLDEERRELYFPFTADVTPEAERRLSGVRLPADRGIVGWVVQHGEPQLVPDVTKDPRWYSNVDKETGQRTQSLLCAPLLTRRGAIGVISLRNKRTGAFTEDDLDFLAALAGSMAVAIENARLYGALRASEAKLREEVEHLHREMAERRRVEAELDRANRLKSDFVATMSHELRTPLHVIIGYNAMLLDKQAGPLSPQQLDVLKRVGKNAQELLGLVDTVLDLSRLEAGRMAVSITPIDVGAFLERLAAAIRQQDRKPDLPVVWEIAPHLPTLHTDARKLEVILTNLIDNAIKFTSVGQVTVTTRAEGDHIEFAVADTGIGIAPEIQPFIFEAFRQGEAAVTRRFGGVGIGLYVIHRLLTVLGATIDVDTEPGRGSTFRVYFPTHPDGASPQPRADA